MVTHEGLTGTPLSKDPNIRRVSLLGASGLVTQLFTFVSLIHFCFTTGVVAVGKADWTLVLVPDWALSDTLSKALTQWT